MAGTPNLIHALPSNHPTCTELPQPASAKQIQSILENQFLAFIPYFANRHSAKADPEIPLHTHIPLPPPLLPYPHNTVFFKARFSPDCSITMLHCSGLLLSESTSSISCKQGLVQLADCLFIVRLTIMCAHTNLIPLFSWNCLTAFNLDFLLQGHFPTQPGVKNETVFLESDFYFLENWVPESG